MDYFKTKVIMLSTIFSLIFFSHSQAMPTATGLILEDIAKRIIEQELKYAVANHKFESLTTLEANEVLERYKEIIEGQIIKEHNRLLKNISDTFERPDVPTSELNNHPTVIEFNQKVELLRQSELHAKKELYVQIQEIRNHYSSHWSRNDANTISY